MSPLPPLPVRRERVGVRVSLYSPAICDHIQLPCNPAPLAIRPPTFPSHALNELPPVSRRRRRYLNGFSGVAGGIPPCIRAFKLKSKNDNHDTVFTKPDSPPTTSKPTTRQN